MPHELRDTFSPIVNAVLRQNMVTIEDDGDTAVPVFNTKYDGLPTSGAVKIPVRNKASVKDYNKEGGTSASFGSTNYIPVVIDKDIVVNEVYDSFDVAAADIDVDKAGERVVDAGLSMSERLDTDGIFALVYGGEYIQRNTRLTEENIVKQIRALDTKFNKLGVPREGRYLIIGSEYHELLLDAKGYDRNLSDKIQEEGYVGKFSSFYVKVTGKIGGSVAMIAGHAEYATRVIAWAKELDFYDLDGSDNYVGAVALKGRSVYAHKVTLGEGIQVVSIYDSANNTAPINKVENVGTKTVSFDGVFEAPAAPKHAFKIIRSADYVQNTLEGIYLLAGEDASLDPDLTVVATTGGTITGINVGDDFVVYALDANNKVLKWFQTRFGA